MDGDINWIRLCLKYFKHIEMNQYFIGEEELLEDAHQLAWKVFKSSFYPTYGISIWR